MPSAFRRADTGRISVKYRDAEGCWQTRQTDFSRMSEARRYAHELERHFERARDGLETAPMDPTRTFGWLYDWWWNEYGSQRRGRSKDATDAMNRKRIIPHLGVVPLTKIDAARIESMIQANAADISGQSLNHLRNAVSVVIDKAKKRGLWHGENPAHQVERRKVNRKAFETLRAEEVPLLLASLEPHWRSLFATAVFTGMRKGELLGLRKSDVDLTEGIITVRRSYDSDTTKGGRAASVPIASELLPW